MSMVINTYRFATAGGSGGGTGLWVVDSTDGGIYPFDPATGTTGTFISLNTSDGAARDIAFDANGDFWYANGSGNLRKYEGGTNTLLNTLSVANLSRGVAIDGNGDLWINNNTNGVYRYSTSGTLLTSLTTLPGVSNARGMSFTSSGLLAVVDSGASVHFYDVSTPSSPSLSREFSVSSAGDEVGIAIRSDGTEWVSIAGGATEIKEYPSGSSGSPTPTQTDSWPESVSYGLAWDTYFS